MKTRPAFAGFIQASGLTIYVGLFAVAVERMQAWLQVNQPIFSSPVLGIMLFLMLFVISALISGSLILGYPAVLFFGGKKAEALLVLLWSVVWLAVYLIIVMLTGASAFYR